MNTVLKLKNTKLLICFILTLLLASLIACSNLDKETIEVHRIQVLHDELKVIWPGSKITGQKNTSVQFTRLNKIDGTILGYAVGEKDIGRWDIEDNTVCHHFKKWRSGVRECMKLYKVGSKYEMYTPNGVLWATINLSPL